jgi:hypothetical protein
MQVQHAICEGLVSSVQQLHNTPTCVVARVVLL